MTYFKKTSILLIAILAIFMCFGCNKIADEGISSVNNSDDYIMCAKGYCSALLDYSFQSKECVSVDNLINYFCIYELTDEKGNFKECYNDCKQDYPNITVPKDIVNDRLEELFDVVIDDSNSIWISKDDESCYYLTIMTRGGLDTPQITEEKVYTEEDYVVLECKMSQEVLIDEVGFITEEKVSFLRFKMSYAKDGNIKILSCEKTNKTD